MLTFYDNAAKLGQFRDPMLMQRFIFQSQCDETRVEGARRMRREEAKTQAGRRDKAVALHCQSGEAINNSVTIKRERGSE